MPSRHSAERALVGRAELALVTKCAKRARAERARAEQAVSRCAERARAELALN